ncbi:hypothetical protein DL93DRAFT_2080942 [Clavulina sp. PMI_390]|nr:hypothetical protein DL93DRAFT_2080942 [Clavulina sp. PMI_390]
MQLARFYTALLFLISSFSLFASASPVATDLMVRGGSCGCGGDVVDALLDLQIKVNADVKLLDGVTDCSKGIDALIADINASAKVIAGLDVSAGFLDADLSLCVSICVQIILAILAGCLKYSIVIILTVVAKLDLAICALINACISLNAGFLAKIDLNADLLAAIPNLTLCGFVNLLALLKL